MKIVLAPDSFKGSLTAQLACEAMETGIRRVMPDAEIVQVPMADGGEGTAQCLVDATGGQMRAVTVRGPLGDPVQAQYGVLGDGTTAVIEMAEASGITLVPAEHRDPLSASTYGTGELIRQALDDGCRSFLLAIGGSATNDGGAGMAQALGAKLLDEDSSELSPGGGALGRLQRIDLSALDERLASCSFQVACDVQNPLCGPTGASFVYGPQKGATPEMVEELDRNLAHYADVIHQELGVDVAERPGAGAAGGLGAGAMAFLRAELKSGVELVVRASELERKLEGTDLVITGEGRSDAQTQYGKTPFGVSTTAQRAGVPAWLVVGSVGPGVEVMLEHGVSRIASLTEEGGVTADYAIAHAAQVLTDVMERLTAQWRDTLH
ncbi:glycerate kinase [Cohnella soli]|uniref:Glycerate kinase n=1 Tax=Cohnella soli TaxID=425005 RepID=A0ABW0HPU9_9BACL